MVGSIGVADGSHPTDSVWTILESVVASALLHGPLAWSKTPRCRHLLDPPGEEALMRRAEAMVDANWPDRAAPMRLAAAS